MINPHKNLINTNNISIYNIFKGNEEWTLIITIIIP
eukprot:UN05485